MAEHSSSAAGLRGTGQGFETYSGWFVIHKPRKSLGEDIGGGLGSSAGLSLQENAGGGLESSEGLSLPAVEGLRLSAEFLQEAPGKGLGSSAVLSSRKDPGEGLSAALGLQEAPGERLEIGGDPENPDAGFRNGCGWVSINDPSISCYPLPTYHSVSDHTQVNWPTEIGYGDVNYYEISSDDDDGDDETKSIATAAHSDIPYTPPVPKPRPKRPPKAKASQGVAAGKSRAWSAEEDSTYRQIVLRELSHKPLRWTKIAEEYNQLLPESGRTMKALQGRYHYTIKPELNETEGTQGRKEVTRDLGVGGSRFTSKSPVSPGSSMTLNASTTKELKSPGAPSAGKRAQKYGVTSPKSADAAAGSYSPMTLRASSRELSISQTSSLYKRTRDLLDTSLAPQTAVVSSNSAVTFSPLKRKRSNSPALSANKRSPFPLDKSSTPSKAVSPDAVERFAPLKKTSSRSNKETPDPFNTSSKSLNAVENSDSQMISPFRPITPDIFTMPSAPGTAVMGSSSQSHTPSTPSMSQTWALAERRNRSLSKTPISGTPHGLSYKRQKR
ncbi:hypothetical protein RUND412_009441 [Rhizina undulata]